MKYFIMSAENRLSGTINKDLQSFTRTSTASNNLIQNFNTKS